MPELPEVETVVRNLSRKINGKRICDVNIYWPRSITTPSKDKFCALLSSVKISAVRRRAKYIVIDLDNKYKLITHLRMSGDLFTCLNTEPEEKHLRVKINFDNGTQLRFVDPRKFGRMSLVKNEAEIFSRLGVEPLSSDFTVEYLKARLEDTRRPIKTVLLDQTIIAGIGNIYAVEALWHARIHPIRKCHTLKKDEIGRLLGAIKKILHNAINSKGTDIGDGVWKKGAFRTSVYGREGEPCKRCKTPIQRIVLAQRGTEFCPKCVKIK